MYDNSSFQKTKLAREIVNMLAAKGFTVGEAEMILDLAKQQIANAKLQKLPESIYEDSNTKTVSSLADWVEAQSQR